MENAENENKIAEALIDWSKWLIGINFSAATGCTIILKNIDEDQVAAVGPYLFGAIISFAISVLISVLITYLLSIHRSSAKLKPFHFLLCKLHLIIFAIGLIFLGLWIKEKSFPNSQKHNCKQATTGHCCILRSDVFSNQENYFAESI